jgi:isoaspartyl peptidase/L-asparaginase-like protein (Ntn-hydrolase superfamily)
MAKPKSFPSENKNAPLSDERSDAWERFERAVDAAIATKQKHRASPQMAKSSTVGAISKPKKGAPSL